MLDLLIFASAFAIAKYISNKNPWLSSSPKSAATDGSHARADYGTDQHTRVVRYIFHSCLLISLLLFSLSILEAAPIAWLVLIDRASLFILWYRALLWALCILLLFIHPSFLGVILGASMFPKKPFVNKSSPTTPSSTNRNHSEGRRRRHPLIICLNILWISIRFFLVTILWRLFRRLMGAMIPYRITRTGGGERNKQRKQRCTTGMVIAALISLSLSFLSLATVGSLILHFDTADSDGFIATDSVPFEEDINTQQVKSAFDYISLKFMVSVICAFGMIIASILNGFGCASLPHANLIGVFLEPTPLSVIAKVEDDCRYAVKTLEEKRWMLVDVTQQSSTARRSPTAHTPSKHKISAEKQRIKLLQEEVIFMENLVGDMNDDIDEMKQSQLLALAARTPFGRIRGVLGVIFSVVLVLRVILAAKSFMSILEGDGNKSFNSPDPLTSVFVWLLGRNIVNAEQYDLFRQATFLVLAGVLSMSQVRAFFRVVGAVGRKLSRTCGMSLQIACVSPKNDEGGQRMGRDNNVALLLSSWLMGCYFLACVTVVKMNLPIEYRSSFSTAVGLNFNFNTKLLNMIFFGSACISAIILASLFGIQRNNSERYQLESQLSSAPSQSA
mmetsp:Transcript_6500/g.14712  ORF Transcript_6500/g.14712 Transcript_6500/m.14712 type:complete len:616 (+) Transcript_6500:395-2242(+)